MDGISLDLTYHFVRYFYFVIFQDISIHPLFTLQQPVQVMTQLALQRGNAVAGSNFFGVAGGLLIWDGVFWMFFGMVFECFLGAICP